VLYSHFGKAKVLCNSCKALTLGRVGEGVSPHWLAVVCTECGKHTSQWIARPIEHDKPNSLVDDAEPIKWKRPQATMQAPTLFEGM
jgi:hypothetical protein